MSQLNNHLSPGNILFIDSHGQNADSLIKLLSSANYHVHSVLINKLLLSLEFTEIPQLILLNVGSSIDRGVELCHQLKSEVLTADIPVIILSDCTETAAKVRAYAAGCIDYISSPFSDNELLLRVKTHGGFRRDSIVEQFGKKSSLRISSSNNKSLEDLDSQFDLTAQTAKIGSWEFDLESEELQWNDETRRIHDVSDNYIPKKGEAFQFCHPDDISMLEGAYQRSLDSGEAFGIELRIITAKGDERWIHTIYNTHKKNNKVYKLSGTCQEITERKRAGIDLQQRIHTEKLIHNVSSDFLGLTSSDTYDAINRTLKAIGEFVAVDRSYVFLFQDEQRTMSNIAEWCAQGISPQIDELQNLSTELFPWWMKNLQQIQHIYVADVDKLAAEATAEKEILQSQGVQSLLVVPLFQGKSLLGFMGFDSVGEKREYSTDEVLLLFTLGGTVSNALIRDMHEVALRESEERFKSMFENMRSRAIVYDAVDDGNDFIFVDFNPVAEKATGRTREELIGTPIRKTFPGVDDIHLTKILKRVWQTGKSEYHPYSYYQDDNLEGWLESSVFKLASNEIVWIYDNVTDRKLAEENLKENEEKYRLLLNNQADLVVKLDRKGQLLFASPSYCNELGQTEDSLLGSMFLAFIHEDDRVQAEADLSKLTQSPGSVTVEARGVAHNAMKWYEWRGNAILDDNGIVNEIVGVGRDISERKNFEKKMASFNMELERRVNLRTLELKNSNDQLVAANHSTEMAMKARASFLANISHEIRTPMNGILGMVDLLKLTNPDQEQSNYISTIHRSSNTLLSVINDVLDYSKLDSDGITLEHRSFSIIKLLNDTVNSHRARLSEKVVMELDVDDGLASSFLLGDAVRLNQVLDNLIGNACKFTDRGFVKVKVVGESLTGNIVRTTFHISDSGIGIAVAQHAEMFQPFTQADSSTSRRFGGSGLGLSICTQLLTLMNSELKLESKLGTGSDFSFTIDFESTTDEEEIKFSPAIVNTSRALEVLLVEDNVVNSQVATSLLKKLGAKVTALAIDGLEAVSLITKENRTFDLILMDCEMPNMDGYQATRMIRSWELENGANRTLIYALTAHAMKEHVDHCIDAGMDGHLAKPITAQPLQNLMDNVERVLANRSH